MIAASRGADIKLVGCYWPGLTYAIYSKAGINSPAELKGKTFAISAPGALPDLPRAPYWRRTISRRPT